MHIAKLTLAMAGLAALTWAAPPKPQDAGALFRKNCAVCHGADGHGQTAKGRKLKVKDLTSAEVQKLSDAELTKVITQGKPPDMDGYADQLSKEEIQAMVAYVHGLGKH
ncbi:MAG TPA: c-type cytochrome [Terriglobales bacterium]|nr:c-type cytochrome [Terriglobales bacterium]